MAVGDATGKWLAGARMADSTKAMLNGIAKRHSMIDIWQRVCNEQRPGRSLGGSRVGGELQGTQGSSST